MSEESGGPRQAEILLAAAIEAAALGFYEMGPGNRVYFSDRRMRALLGIPTSQEDRAREFWLEHVHPDDLRTVLEKSDKILKGETGRIVTEYRYQHPDGHLLWLSHVSKVLARDQDGIATHVVGVLRDITEEKRNEEELYRTREQYKLALEGSEDGLWDWDIGPNTVYYSRRWKAMLGYSEDELSNVFDTWQELLHADDRERAMASMHAYLADPRSTYELECRLRHKDGRYRWILMRGKALCDARGRPYRMTGSNRDITARKRTEEALEQARVQALAVVNSTNDLIWSVDPERFGLLTWNRAFKDYFLEGRGIDIAVGMTPAELMPPDYVGRWHEMFSQALREGSFNTEYVVVPQATVLLLSLHAMKQGGHVFGISVFGKDITDRKRVEEALRENEARLASALDAADLAYYEVTNGDNVTHLDSRARDVLGISREQDHGVAAFQFWTNHLHPDDHARILDLHRQLNAGIQDRVTAEYRYFHPQRGMVWIHHLSHVLKRDAARQAVRTIGTLRDITGHKSAEAETLRLRQDLSHASRVTTLGEMVSAFAHELNQPLAAVLSNAEAADMLLRADPPDIAESLEILADIRRDDERAGEIIQRIRRFLRKREVERVPLDANELVRDVVRLVHNDAALREVVIETNLAPDLPLLQGDRVQLQQVLVNLTINAMDAMAEVPEGKRKLVLRTARTVCGGVEVAVTDSGTGIPADHALQLFEPFYSSKPNGLGMGLSISRTIVESHGGSITAENHPNRGATFRVTLPAG